LNESHLERTCKSIVNQTFQDFEWIVIDGYSNAETIAVLEKYKNRMNCFVSEKDNGVYEAMNKGIELSHGTWLNFMNAGDFFISDNILNNIRKILELRQDMDVLHGETIYDNFDLQTLSHTPDKNLLAHLSVSALRHQASFIKRTCFIRYGYYDASLKVVADHKFFIILCKNSVKFLRINSIIAVMAPSGISASGKHRIEREQVMESLFSAKELKAFQKKTNPARSVAANLRTRFLAKKRGGHIGTAEHPKISIIIPVYNTEPYLRRCLDSVCAQTMHDLEIICVNDGSEDSSLFVLREYAVRDSRVVLVNFYPNKGVSAARNAGMAIARGVYLGFVDSDDVIDPNFYEKLYTRAKASDAYIVKGIRVKVDVDGIITEDPLNDKIRKDKFGFNSQWTTAIYRTNFIRDNGILCPLGVTNSEDVAFVLKAVSLASDIEIVDDACYRYYRRTNSASSTILSLHKVLSALQAYNDIIAFLNTRNVSERDYDALFLQCLFLSCNLYTRTCPKERNKTAMACAHAAIKLYSACKRPAALEAGILNTRADWFPFLQGGDVLNFAVQLLAAPQSLMQKNAAKLRARLQSEHYNSAQHCNTIKSRVLAQEFTEAPLAFGTNLIDFSNAISTMDIFYDLYKSMPKIDNIYGMKSPHLFLMWFALRQLRPSVIIESGVYKGLGTWWIEQACPESELFCIDINYSNLEYRSKKARYLYKDFSQIEWKYVDKDNSILFFNDHQNAFKRLIQMRKFRFNRAIFEDNYPPSFGDCNSCKKILSKCGISSSIPSETAFFLNIVNAYQEFPPPFQPDATRWGTPWETPLYKTPPPILSQPSTRAQEVLFREAKSYTFMCMVSIDGR
jgi:glycosyltransferase involved in cell wall biosynthesis